MNTIGILRPTIVDPLTESKREREKRQDTKWTKGCTISTAIQDGRRNSCTTRRRRRRETRNDDSVSITSQKFRTSRPPKPVGKMRFNSKRRHERRSVPTGPIDSSLPSHPYPSTNWILKKRKNKKGNKEERKKNVLPTACLASVTRRCKTMTDGIGWSRLPTPDRSIRPATCKSSGS